jgi:hypothetical protein
MKGHLEVVLKLCFYTKPPKFGAEAHIEVLAGVALRIGLVASVKRKKKNGID